jgi:hypothetical protein
MKEPSALAAAANSSPTIPPSVSKQLATVAIALGENDPIHGNNNNKNSNTTSKRVPPEAAEAISEALRLFVREAHRRASIEAECDDEGHHELLTAAATTTGATAAASDAATMTNHEQHTPIDAHHVTRIAGDLLMDFS